MRRLAPDQAPALRTMRGQDYLKTLSDDQLREAYRCAGAGFTKAGDDLAANLLSSFAALAGYSIDLKGSTLGRERSTRGIVAKHSPRGGQATGGSPPQKFTATIGDSLAALSCPHAWPAEASGRSSAAPAGLVAQTIEATQLALADAPSAETTRHSELVKKLGSIERALWALVACARRLAPYASGAEPDEDRAASGPVS